MSNSYVRQRRLQVAKMRGKPIEAVVGTVDYFRGLDLWSVKEGLADLAAHPNLDAWYTVAHSGGTLNVMNFIVCRNDEVKERYQRGDESLVVRFSPVALEFSARMEQDRPGSINVYAKRALEVLRMQNSKRGHRTMEDFNGMVGHECFVRRYLNRKVVGGPEWSYEYVPAMLLNCHCSDKTREVVCRVRSPLEDATVHARRVFWALPEDGRLVEKRLLRFWRDEDEDYFLLPTKVR